MRGGTPLIYAGGGVVAAEAAPVLRDFVTAFGLPVATTLMGLGAIDTTEPLALHMLGMHGTAFANYAVEDCDFVLALGARFDDRVAGVPDKFAPGLSSSRRSTSTRPKSARSRRSTGITPARWCVRCGG